MLVFSSNIEMLAPPVDFYERFKIAHDSGFSMVEFWSWENKSLQKIKDLCSEYKLGISSLSGDGPEFSLCDDSHRKKYIEYARASMAAAHSLGCRMIVIHSNALDSSGQVVDAYEDTPLLRLFLNMQKTLLELTPYAEKAGITCVLEPLNAHVDHPGYALRSIQAAAHLIETVDSPWIKILYDLYHMQIETGNLIPVYEKFQRHIGHIHCADSPGRHEPGTGEINYGKIFSRLEELKYPGIVAFELSPVSDYESAVQAILSLR